MIRVKILVAAAMTILVIAPSAGIAFPWDQDMRDQPSVKPQEAQTWAETGTRPSENVQNFIRSGRKYSRPVPWTLPVNRV